MSSPEFCFLQMADQMSLVELIELGYELCGTYSISQGEEQDLSQESLYDKATLTNTKKLEDFTDHMQNTRGRANATRALRYVQDGSASPMETKLTMLLTLPYRLGGYGFIMPEMNSNIIPTKSVRKASSKARYACDLFWPDYALAVEYDSDQYHTGSARIAHDAKRKNALASLDITVITVTRQQVYSSVEFERVARLLAENMERRLVYKRQSFAAAQYELRRQLLYPALFAMERFQNEMAGEWEKAGITSEEDIDSLVYETRAETENR